MYPVSADFHNLSIADAPTSRVRIYFIEANVDCTDDNNVQSNGTLLCMPGETDSNGRIENGGVTINEFFNSDANVQIGATVSSQIGMTLINRDGALDGFNYGRCKVYIDVYDDTNSTWLTCPMGVYNIAIPKRRKVQLVSATGYDQMQQLDEIADSWWNGLDWSNGITLLQIIQSMAATLGIHLSANTSANIVNSGLSYTEIPFTSIEMTYRDILSYIAETTGTIARFDRNGALDLRWFSDAVLSTDTQTYAGGLVTFTATNRASISSLSVPFSPIQDLHGYSNPWPAGGGKNMFDISFYNLSSQWTNVSGVITNVDAPLSSSYNGCSLNGRGTTTLLAGTYTLSLKARLVSGEYTAGNFNALRLHTNGANIKDFQKVSNPMISNEFQLYYGTMTLEESYTFEDINLQFSTGLSNAVFEIKEIQIELSAAPTSYAPYSNICPISGRTGLSVYDDPKYGGTVAWNQLLPIPSSSKTATVSGVTVTDNRDGSYTLNGTATSVVANVWFYGGYNNAHAEMTLNNDHVFFCDNLLFFPSQDNTGNVSYARNPNMLGEVRIARAVGNYSISGLRMMNFTNGATYTNRKIIPMLFDLTQMFGSTIADYIYSLEQADAGAGVAWFRNLFPKDYYPYDNIYTATCVSAVNGDPYWKKDIDWTSEAGTVYGGTPDVVTGVLTDKMGNITVDDFTSFVNGSSSGGLHWVEAHVSVNANAEAISSMLEWKATGTAWRSATECFATENGRVRVYTSASSLSDFKTRFADLTVVYELATPLTYQLTAQEIAALVGTNNVWSTGDSVSVTVSEPTLVEIQTDTVGNQCLSIDVGEYQVSQIDALSVKASQADVGVTIGSGGNAYTILDNPMLFGDEAAITTKATPIYNRLSAFRLFTPISMRCIMDWSIEAGDIITVTNESVTYDLPIFQQRLRWRGGYVVSDLFSNGEQERPTQSKEIRSSFRSNTQMHEFEVTLEQLRSYIQSVDGNYTLIQQTIDAITQTVANQNVTIQNILDPTGEIWTAITKNTSNLSSIEDSLNNEITERRSYIRFIPSEPAIVMGVDEDNEIKLKLVNNIIYFFNGADDSTDLSLAYAYFNSQEAFADRFVAGESVQIGTNDNAAHWLWKKLNNGDLVLELVG